MLIHVIIVAVVDAAVIIINQLIKHIDTRDYCMLNVNYKISDV